jgi:hypothetical protein
MVSMRQTGYWVGVHAEARLHPLISLANIHGAAHLGMLSLSVLGSVLQVSEQRITVVSLDLLPDPVYMHLGQVQG